MIGKHIGWPNMIGVITWRRDRFLSEVELGCRVDEELFPPWAYVDNRAAMARSRHEREKSGPQDRS